jgi:hypothetical protein
MKSINLPLAVCISLCMFVSCKNKYRSDEKNIALENIKQEEEKVPASRQELPSNDNSDVATNADFKVDSLALPQLLQKQAIKNSPPPQIDWDKKIIKEADINAEVHNYDSFYSSVREKIRNAGGYVAQEKQNQSDYKIENTITIKVPVDQFDKAITSLIAGTEKVNERKVTSQDVTTEVVDTKSRIEAKKEVRLKYIDLLKQAKNMSEILNVQSEINDIQEEIESAAGRINYLSHSSAFSTINFTFYQVLNVSARDYEEPSFRTKISTSFKTGLHWVGELIVGLISVWPLVLFILIVWVVIKKYIRSKPNPSSVAK